MMRRANATRIGAFVLGGLALLVTAVVLISGGGLFARSERGVMYFEGSVYGLQLGAPVVFRGLRVGRVVAIGLDGSAAEGFRIPVQVTLDSERLGGTAEPVLPALVARGLRGQLATQSLLTGLLYVDLDLLKAAPGAAAVTVSTRDGEVVIPTVSAPVQALLSQLQTLDVPQLLADIGAIAGGTRELVASPDLRRSLQELAALGGDLRRLSAKLDRRVEPLADATQRTLADTRLALEQLGRAAEQVQANSARAGAQFDGLVAEGRPALQSARQAADELARSATALRLATGEDSALMQNVDRTTQEVGRAARALRELAELLERQPQAVIRGRAEAP
jgi:paraquat-inducible protein B